VRENVGRVASRLEMSGPVIGGPLAAGRLRIVGAVYSLDHREVEFLDT
jgi:hypothetical protein